MILKSVPMLFCLDSCNKSIENVRIDCKEGDNSDSLLNTQLPSLQSQLLLYLDDIKRSADRSIFGSHEHASEADRRGYALFRGHVD